MRTDFDYSGASVVVTGASQGIGLAVARAYALAGADVLVISDTDDIPSVASELTREARRLIRGAFANVTKADELRSAFEGMSQIDVLINNSVLGTFSSTDGPRCDSERSRRVMDRGLAGLVVTTRAVVPLMAGKAPSIVNLLPPSRPKLDPDANAFEFSGNAVIDFTRTCAAELAPKGIRVNAVCTPDLRGKTSVARSSSRFVEDSVVEGSRVVEFTSAHPVDVPSEAEDATSACMFLTSNGARFITGQTLVLRQVEITP